MRNLCQIPWINRKIWAATLIIVSLMCSWTPTAESLSVKLRGKIALAGILSGIAYATHVLVKRDRQATAQLELRLGPPDRVVQFERGFDLWRINYYRTQAYLFRNDRFIRKEVLKAPFSRYDARPNSIARLRWKRENASNPPPFLIDTPVLVTPKWLQLSPLHPLQAPRLVSSDLYPWGAEGRLRSLSSYSSRRLYLSWSHLRAHRYAAPSHPLP